MSRPLSTVRPSSCPGRYEGGEEREWCGEDEEDDAPMSAVELFAGAGGASLGLHRAGFRSLARCEWDPDACATLRAAFPGEVVIEGDVRAVDWSPYAGRCDLLWASPPCQAWSSAGKRLGAADERNGWPWTFDACDAIRPTSMVCENVPGLTHHKGDCDRSDPLACPGCYWLGWILPEARRRFAHVSVLRLDAADYGVPQRRHRVFLVCGPRPVACPVPTHGDPALMRQGALFGPRRLPWRTVREALGLGGSVQAGVADSDTGARGIPRSTDEPGPAVSGFSGTYSRIIGGGSNPHGKDAASNPHGKDAAHERTYRDLTDEPSTTVAAEQIGNAGPFVVDTERTLDPDRPAFTLRAQGGTDASGHMGGHAGVYVVDPKHAPFDPDAPAGSILSASADTRAEFTAAGIRRLTVLECATLQDFPADHPWQGTKTAQYRQVGNAVPPTMARVVAGAVIAARRTTG